MNLNNFLSSCTEIEFNELFHRIEIAKLLRSIEVRYKVTPESMASRLGITEEFYKEWRLGANDFSVKDLANIEVLDNSLYVEKNDLIKIELNKKGNSNG
jgi:hypothetical protein